MGTMTFITPPPLVEVEENAGACFSIRTDLNPCFAVKSTQEWCFRISGDEEESTTFPPPELEVEGFSSIKCIQSHGDMEMVLIGVYQPENAEPREVIAKFTYIESTYGGVRKVTNIDYYVNLDMYEGITIANIDRLDGWDIESITSSLCIVLTDGTAIWLDGVLFVEQNRATDANDCYFEEDTYSIPSILNTSWQSVKMWLGYTQAQISNESNCHLLNFWVPNSDDIDWPSPAIPYWYSSGQATVWKIQTRDQTDQSVITTGISGSTFITGSYPCPTVEDLIGTYPNLKATQGDLANKVSLIPLLKRKGIIILENASSNAIIYFGDDFGSMVDYGWRLRWVETRPTYCNMLQEGRDGSRGTFIDTSTSLSIGGIDPLQVGKISVGSKYLMYCGGGNTTFYNNADSADTTVIGNRNITLVGSVAIEADGTNLIKQTLLESVE